MIKKILSFVTLVLCAVTLQASPVSRSEAARLAANFWTQHYGGEAIMEESASSALFPEMYIFNNTKSAGFVIISADDCVIPILAYSDQQAASELVPASVRAWLQDYAAAIRYCVDNDVPATSDIAEQWRRLREGAPLDDPDVPHNTVAAMLTTTWGQGTHYNDLCPFDNTANERTVTGCVATAMAQLMKFWNKPTVGLSSKTYTHSVYGNLSANFSNTYYDWTHMPDALNNNSSQTEKTAVATLMYHCGVAVEMFYDISANGGSAAQTTAYGSASAVCAENALKQYFDYKTTLVGMQRDDYDDATWTSRVITELDAGRPVIYTGHDESGGHAFVCDGYDNNTHFHINWGWQGAYDGFFALSALNPGGGGTGSNATYTFNSGQTMIVGIEPNSGSLRVSPSSVTLSGLGGTDSVYVRTNNQVSTGWTASCSSGWLTISPTSGNGSGRQTLVRITAQPNTTSATRTAAIVITQGAERDTIHVTQPDGTTSPTGWYGNTTASMYMSFDAGREFIVRPECLGNFPAGSQLSQIKFSTYNASGYDNNSFTVKIYEDSRLNSSIRSNGYTLANDCLGTVVRSQAYTQQSFGEQIVTLSTPYIVGNSPFWVAVEVGGSSAILADRRMVNCTVAVANLPLLDSIDGRYLRKYTSGSTDILHLAYGSTYTNTEQTYAQPFNVDYALSLYINTNSTYTVTANSSNASMGSVTGGGSYAARDTAILAATPNCGYAFTQWSDGDTNNPRLLVVGSDTTLTAQFAASVTKISHVCSSGQTLYYTLDCATGKATVTYPNANGSWAGYTMPSGALTIPNSITHNNATYTVTAIGDSAFRNCTSLTSLTFGDSLTSIGNFAFRGCTGLTGALTLPNTVSSIGSGAFFGCNGLSGTLVIPSSITYIRSSAFRDCSGLTSLTLPASVTNILGYSFFGCSGLDSIRSLAIVPPTMESYAFDNSVTSKPLYIPCSALSAYSSAIGWSSFSNIQCAVPFLCDTTVSRVCSTGQSLRYYLNCDTTATLVGYNGTVSGSLAIPDTINVDGIVYPVTSIDDSAFYYCESLTSITIPNSVTSIGNYAFRSCSGITGLLTIPGSVTSIGDHAFFECIGLTSVTIGGSVTSIDNYAFSCCRGLTSIVVASGNTHYDSRNNCNAIIETATNTLIAGCQNTIIPNSVTSIGHYAFYGCSGLTSVAIPNSVTSIGSWAFFECTNLTSITIPNSVTIISLGAFLDCRGLTSITIPNSVTVIYLRTFENCSGLTSITCLGRVAPSLSTAAFTGVSDTIPVYVPCGSEEAYRTADGWNYFSNIQCVAGFVCDTIVSRVCSTGQSLNYYLNCDTTATLVGFNGTISGSLYIPDTINVDGIVYPITSIGDSAFYRCSSLTGALTIPNSVTRIGNSAFNACRSLNGALTIPNSVTTIGEYAFNGCSSLNGALTIPNSVTTIGKYAFFSCMSFSGALTIPSSITSIGSYAFYYCMGLNGALTIPNSITRIADYAFEGCGFTSVTMPDSATHIGWGAFQDCMGLTSVTIPNTVDSIDQWAFNGCSGLTSITSLATVPPTLGRNVFSSVPSTSQVYVPCGTKATYRANTGWSYFSNIQGIYDNASTESDTSCNTYTWHGRTFSASTDTATYVTTNAAGCDSTITLNLTMHYSSSASETDTACNSFLWNNHGSSGTFTSSNTYFSSYYTPEGCLSVDTLYLTINNSTFTDTAITACDSLIWNGVLYSLNGAYVRTYQNADGCLSADTLHLTIQYPQSTATDTAACDSLLWHETLYILGGTYTRRWESGVCINTDTLHLTINSGTSGIETVTTCNSYLWHGRNLSTSTDTATYHTTNAAGCDSTVTLHLTINQCSFTEITACDLYDWHGTAYTTGGTYISGTDTLVLTIIHSTTSTETDTACNSYTWHSRTFSASTDTATYHTTNAAGCDSTVTLNLTVNHCSKTLQTACDSFLWDITGLTYTETDMYISGSDTLLLTVNYSTTSTEIDTACNTYTWHNRTFTTPTDTATYHTTNAAGCDSTVTLDLVINYCSLTELTVCDSFHWDITGQTYTESNLYVYGTDTLLLTVNYSSVGAETDTACNSYTWHGRTFSASTDTATFHTTNVAGCDSTVTLNLTIFYDSSMVYTVSDTASYTWTSHGTTNTYSQSGTYTNSYTTTEGCPGTDTLRLTITTSTPTQYYTVRALSSNNTMGQASVVGDSRVLQGTTATVRATANSGYRFVRWSNGATANPYTFTVTRDTLLTAIFEGNSYTVTIVNGNPDRGIVSGSGTAAYGSRRNIAAAPNHGYIFSHWSDGDSTAHRFITVTGDITLTAYFGVQQFRVDAQPANYAQGSVSGGGSYDYLAYATLTATPRNGYVFHHWSDGDTLNPRRLQVMRDTTLTAYFVQGVQQYTLTVVSANPTMGSTFGGGTYEAGTTATIRAAANDGYEFDIWTDGVTSNPRNVTILSDTTFTATFRATVPPDNHTYTISVMSSDENLGRVSGGGTYAEGTTVHIAAYPAAHCLFRIWSDGSTSAHRTITVNGNMTLVAVFSPDSATVTARANDDRMGRVEGGGKYAIGSTATLRAVPNSGYRFVRWRNGETESTISVVVQYNLNYTAIFESTTQGIDETDDTELRVWSHAMTIRVAGLAGQPVKVYDLTGRLIADRPNATGYMVIPVAYPGLYLVQTGTATTHKVIVR